MRVRVQKISCVTCSSRDESFMNFVSLPNLETIDEEKSCNHFKKGQPLFFEGNHPLGLYCIKSGAVKVFKTGFTGKDQIIKIAGGGDFLGYRALIAEETYSDSAEALEDTVACFIPRIVFHDILDKEKDFSKQLMKSLCHDLGLAGERIMNMAQKNVRERLAETLLSLTDHFSIPQEDGSLLIGVQLPREDLANLTGTSTETAIRLLSEFKDDHLIKFEGKKLFITNEKALRKVAQTA